MLKKLLMAVAILFVGLPVTAEALPRTVRDATLLGESPATASEILRLNGWDFQRQQARMADARRETDTAAQIAALTEVNADFLEALLLVPQLALEDYLRADPPKRAKERNTRANAIAANATQARAVQALFSPSHPARAGQVKVEGPLLKRLAAVRHFLGAELIVRRAGLGGSPENAYALRNELVMLTFQLTDAVEGLTRTPSPKARIRAANAAWVASCLHEAKEAVKVLTALTAPPPPTAKAVSVNQ